MSPTLLHKCLFHKLVLFLCIYFCIYLHSNVQAISNSELDKLRHLFQNESELLSSHPACKNEITQLCGNNPDILQNNVAILNCIAEHSDSEQKLAPECQHQIWSFKYKITNTGYFTEITKNVCKLLLVSNQDCLEAEHEDALSPGTNILSCLMDRIQPNTNYACKTYLKEMELITFSDYRIIHKFANLCESHIKKYTCGRLDDSNTDENSLHSQTNTVECLQNHIDNLSNLCKHEILRISELQSDDFHLDKPLYFACRADREIFCKDVESGNGRIYKCLMKNKHNSEMSEICKDKLTQRERLIAHDYKVSKSLVQSCHGDIKRYQCRENTSSKKEIRLAQILLCLENAHTKNLPISSDCISEMFIHRRSLVDDYKLTPSLVDACQYDINELCQNVEFGAKTLHCLMKFAKTKRHRGDAHTHKRISTKCQREIEILLKEANVGEDWRVDIVLQEACQSTVDRVCTNVKPGNGRVLNCLSENIDSHQMTEECRETLHQMQYFVARNFEIDTQLYESCHNDAVKYCHAKRDWFDDPDHMDPERGPTVLACLYRYVYHEDETVRLKKQCIYHVKRIMKQRASSVDLLPFIEEPCIEDLAKFCSSNYLVDKKGYEMECLQNNYNQLQSNCKNVIGNFTEAQGSHFELNYPLFKMCLNIAKELCPQEYENSYDDDQGEIIQCLIQHKNNRQMKSNVKCRAAIEHFQLINLKDFRFDAKFKNACKADIVNHCNRVRTKYDVVNCLSTIVYNDTLSSKRRVSSECKNLLRVELLQLGENILFDPNLAEACRFDSQKYCSDVEIGESHVIECLKSNIVKLKKSCQRQMFRKQYVELVDNSVDYSLLTICKSTIDRYCYSAELQEVLYCLRDHRNELGIGHNCRSLIMKRIAQQNQDYRLNPRLKGSCKKEISVYCADIINRSKPDELLDGKVIACLKKQYLLSTLSQTCEIEIVNIIREVSSNIELDPILFRTCQKEISKKCSSDLDIHECLKGKFFAKQIEDAACKREIARLIKETEADIESDPHLYNVCVQDLKTFCGDVISGKGQKLNCLSVIHRISPHKLTQECDTLLQKRIQLFEYAGEVFQADSMAQVIQMVANSPIHNYFYLYVGAIFLFIFICGLFCGRFAHPVAVSDKIK